MIMILFVDEFENGDDFDENYEFDMEICEKLNKDGFVDFSDLGKPSFKKKCNIFYTRV